MSGSVGLLAHLLGGSPGEAHAAVSQPCRGTMEVRNRCGNSQKLETVQHPPKCQILFLSYECKLGAVP